MSKAKTAVPPQPNNRTNTGKRQRNDKGQFIAGNKNGGRPKLREEFKAFAQEKSLDALRVVWQIMEGAETNNRDRLAAARLLMEYGYGRPAAELDRERLEIDRGRLDLERQRVEKDSADAVPIEVIISPQGEEYGE